ncbi:uncharacterized protein LOC133187908 [Saccostrea echinata]|uniref:uncharacterized protein LOC133187908 n=1 Tax=Saccostrea echinata TaxID=191078 RepID=UPI002A81EF8A|nr:uncharacterized protein LOC133187908 [Saccostrea echinata]
MEGDKTAVESPQYLINNTEGTLYKGDDRTSPSVHSAEKNIAENGEKQNFTAASENFSVNNILTTSNENISNSFRKTGPAIKKIKPTVEKMKKNEKKPRTTKSLKERKGRKSAFSEDTPVNTLTPSMSPALGTKTPDPFYEGFGFFETTTPLFIEMTSTTTPAPLTPFAPKQPSTTFSPCPPNIRANPNNRNEYHYLSGPWSGYYIKCPAGLQFREDKCICDYPYIESVKNCPCCESGVMKHDMHRNMFKRLINGVWVDDSCQFHSMVWDDKECKCVWDTKMSEKEDLAVEEHLKPYRLYNERCVTLLNMTFDKELKDEDGKHITGTRKIHSRRFKAIKGAVNKAMLFVYTPFELQSFKGNSLERNIYISFNFKPVIQNAKKVTLFTNGCETQTAIRQILSPSIEINFFPRDETMEFILKTESKSVDIHTKPVRDPFDWYRVRMYLQDNVLTIIVNNVILYRSAGLNGKIISTNCNLMIGGSPFSNDQRYMGYMDEILIVKQCPYAKINNIGLQAG